MLRRLTSTGYKFQQRQMASVVCQPVFESAAIVVLCSLRNKFTNILKNLINGRRFGLHAGGGRFQLSRPWSQFCDLIRLAGGNGIGCRLQPVKATIKIENTARRRLV